MKKLTAVQWLQEKYNKNINLIPANFEEALAMEKKQSLYSFFAGYNYEGAFPVDEHEEYYKETFTENGTK
jgi:hypothetical protein